MANRSDFLSATLPRRFRRMLALQPFKDAHERGVHKRLWIEAHRVAKRAKQRSNSSPAGRAYDASVDAPEAAE